MTTAHSANTAHYGILAARLMAASFAVITVAGILMINAVHNSPRSAGPFITDLSTLSPQDLVRFQQAAGINRQNTMASVTISLPRDEEASRDVQPLLEARGWTFYSHWGAYTAAVPISEQQLLRALPRGPEAVLEAARTAAPPPPGEPLANYWVHRDSPRILEMSPLFIAATTMFAVWVGMLATAVYLFIKSG